MASLGFMSNVQCSRRNWLRRATLAGASPIGASWLSSVASAAAAAPPRNKACILLWMSGGPSQIDTLDPKPQHENGGEFRPIATSVPGIQVCEHLPKLARVMDDVTLVRSMSTKEGDHSRGTYLVRTGQPLRGPIQYPTMGALLSKELAAEGRSDLPGFVSIGPYRAQNPDAYSAGFLGPSFAPLIVGETPEPQLAGAADYQRLLTVKNVQLAAGVDRTQADQRLELLRGFEDDQLRDRPSSFGASHQTAYRRAVRMMRSAAMDAFQLDDEPDKLRDAYGRNHFGQGCLLARRLVQRGVSFIEVSLNATPDSSNLGWDSHLSNFPKVKALCEILDPAWATLIADLKSHGLLDSTMVVWMGEFGRTPRINRSAGRDHFPRAWSTALAGGGIRGGHVVGATSQDGMEIVDRPVSIADLLTTICRSLEVDPATQNTSNVGRPISLADPEGAPLTEILS